MFLLLVAATCGATFEAAGKRYMAGAFAFTPPDFEPIEAPVVLALVAETPLDACGQVVSSKEAIRGAIVVVTTVNHGRCGPAPYAKMFHDLGAAALVTCVVSDFSTSPSPGRSRNFFNFGDTTSPGIVAVDATQVAMRPLLEKLADGALIKGRLLNAPPSSVEVVWASPSWRLHQAIAVVLYLPAVEAAVLRLAAFSRADARSTPTLAHAVLSIELVVCLIRIVYHAVDPMWSRGVFSIGLGLVLANAPFALSAAGSCLFLVYFSSAAASNGFASLRLTRPAVRRTLMVGILALLLMEIVSSALILSFGLLELVVLKLGVSTVTFPLLMAIFGMVAERNVRKDFAANIPAPLLKKLTGALRVCNVCNLATAIFGMTLIWALSNPYRTIVITIVMAMFEAYNTYVKVVTFKPIGITVLDGPLGMLLGKLGRTVRSRRSLASTVVVPTPGRIVPTIISPDTVPAHLLLGVSPVFMRAFAIAHGVKSDAKGVDVAELIRNLAQSTGKSICEMSRDERTADGHPAVGRATLFVSHAQSCTFSKLCDAIDHHCLMHGLVLSSTFVWVRAERSPQHVGWPGLAWPA